MGNDSLTSSAYYLGGIRFLLPDDGWSTETKAESKSDEDVLVQFVVRTESVQQSLNSRNAELEDGFAVEQLMATDRSSKRCTFMQESLKAAGMHSSQPHRLKRRKELSTADRKTISEKKPVKHHERKPCKKPVDIQRNSELLAPIKSGRWQRLHLVQ
ncbi:unnamed protein product [Phytophthora fragariaefolia]|uniref:Unnamed protein product n=1 Tax=Phytophthora fragariaefolia TaxID=1490495 RepID=A0A9W6XXX5_9STRA|nr:unnamed protein product [Phytophthora fragariaefolia]